MNLHQSYRTAVTAFMVCLGFAASAQPNMTDPNTAGAAGMEPVNTNWKPSLVRDGAYDRVPHASIPLAWQNLREDDVLWKRRVWREIDTREKQNLQFRYPGDDETGGGYFIEILLDAIKKGKIKAYSSFDDRFTTALTKEQIMEKFAGKIDTTYVSDPDNPDAPPVMKISHRDFNPDIITKYRVKEDWMFDRNVGRMVVRIIGIAPMEDIYDDNNNFRASSPMFWIFYPEARSTFAQYEVFNPANDVNRMTWDDYWEGRFWHGRIIQVSNPFNSNSFKNMGMSDMESLYQGNRAQDDIINKELDMWEN